VLERARLEGLLRYAADLGLDALVEVHTPSELGAALESGAAVIGVNSRDLDTFRIDTEAAWKMVRQVPSDRIAVAESGMAGQLDVVRVAEAGADAVLVGTALSAAPSPERLLTELSTVRRHGR
jgi:indole-3-glycerol phosphate synthase